METKIYEILLSLDDKFTSLTGEIGKVKQQLDKVQSNNQEHIMKIQTLNEKDVELEFLNHKKEELERLTGSVTYHKH